MTNNNYKKKLIEVAIPLEAINKGSAYEKLPGIGPHPRGIHLWWARRPHVVCRSILFSQLVDDPSSHPKKFPTEEKQREERERLFKIIVSLADWKNNGNSDLFETAQNEIKKSCGGELPLIFDPFSGGCSIPLEAQRLGLPTYGSDLNPVAVMIGKAMVEIAPKFKNREPVHPGGKDCAFYTNAEGIAEDVRYYGEEICKKAERLLAHNYPDVELPRKYGGGRAKVVAWLWAKTVQSPDPSLNGLHVPLVRSFKLSTAKGRRSWIEPVVKDAAYHFAIRSEALGDTGEALEGTVGRSGGRCIVSGAAIPLNYIRDQAKTGKMGQTLMAIAAEGRRGKIYLDPTTDARNAAIIERPDTLPFGKIDHWPGCTNCVVYGMEEFSSLFSNRQATTLITLAEIIQEIRGDIEKDAVNSGLDGAGDVLRNGGTGVQAYAEAIIVFLAFSLSRALDFNNMLTGWRPGNEKIMYLFSRHAIPMTWDYGEANILRDVVGGLPGIIKYQSKCIETLSPNNSGCIVQADVREVNCPDNVVISTDPPYYDNIPYSNLSDFFYIWMRLLLKDIYPDLFETIQVPKSQELVANQFRQGSKSKAEAFFLEGMKVAIKRMSDQCSPKYLLHKKRVMRLFAGVYSRRYQGIRLITVTMRSNSL